MCRSLGVSINTSLASIIAKVVEYFSTKTDGKFARTCSGEGIHSISFKCWYKKHIQVVMYLDTEDIEMPNHPSVQTKPDKCKKKLILRIKFLTSLEVVRIPQ